MTWSLPDDPLGENYDPVVYWPAAGVIYEAHANLAAYRPQEEAWERVLAPLEWQTVLDVGCGFGRLGEMIRRIRPDATYTGVDISPDQIRAAERRLPDAEFHVDSILGWDDERTFDLVISAEVIMHQPAAQIEAIFARLFGWSHRYIVTCDWHEPGLEETANAWNVAHDYPALYGSSLVSTTVVERQAIFVAKVGA